MHMTNYNIEKYIYIFWTVERKFSECYFPLEVQVGFSRKKDWSVYDINLEVWNAYSD